jgi:hypothetical protein
MEICRHTVMQFNVFMESAVVDHLLSDACYAPIDIVRRVNYVNLLEIIDCVSLSVSTVAGVFWPLL